MVVMLFLRRGDIGFSLVVRGPGRRVQAPGASGSADPRAGQADCA